VFGSNVFGSNVFGSNVFGWNVFGWNVLATGRLRRRRRIPITIRPTSTIAPTAPPIS
jgi:hypothetical protein